MRTRSFHRAGVWGLILLPLTALLVVLVSPGPIRAQSETRVTGTVSNGETGEPVTAAQIEVLERSTGAVSGSEGRYLLFLAPGRYRLVASSIGFESDTVAVEVEEGATVQRDIILTPTAVALEGFTVQGDAIDRRVQDMAREREERRASLENYTATIHRLGLVYETPPGAWQGAGEGENGRSQGPREISSSDTSEVIAFSERVIEQLFVTPRTYGERQVARRASDNFFSEREVFSTGGRPLDLNEEEVQLNLLSEVVSVVGPISDAAPRFYRFDERPADSRWPEGTIEMRIEPRSDRRPLFVGSVFILEEDEGREVVGMDLRINEAGQVFTPIYSISNFRFYQEFEQVEEYWLPDLTVVQARVGVLGFGDDFIYRERWRHTDYQVNRDDLARSEIPLSGVRVEENAGERSDDYWSQISERYIEEPELEELRAAQSYEEERFIVNFSAAAFRIWARTPQFLERFYLTNIADLYRFNRVEGNYLGIGLRTPAVQENFAYRGSVGRATEAEDWRYKVDGLQYFPGTDLGIEAGFYKKLSLQFNDPVHAVGPLNVDELRYTLGAAFAGYDPRNYFERQGVRAGLRYRFGQESFVRGGYLREEHTFLPIVTTRGLFQSYEVGGALDPNLNPRVGETPEGLAGGDELEGFTPGKVSGLELALHHDTRQFRQNGVFRNYLVREFGWFTDHWVRWSDPAFGTADDEGFEFVRYRSSAGMRMPLFDSHFLNAEIFLAGASRPLPAQLQFAGNGFFIEDYIRRRPILTLGFNEGVGNRSSVARVEYNIGSGLVRLFPISSIRTSGIQTRVWVSGALRHDEAKLRPVMPWTAGRDDHIEVGVGMTKILGVFAFEVGFRAKGDDGDSVSFRFIL